MRIRIVRIGNNRLGRTRRFRHRIGITLMIMDIAFLLSALLLNADLRCAALSGRIRADFSDFNFYLQNIITFGLAAETVQVIRDIFTDARRINSIFCHYFKLIL